MNKISQKEIAVYLDVSQQLICDIRKKRRTFGKITARRISDLTGIPYDIVAFGRGDDLMKKLLNAYLKLDNKND